VLNPLSLMVLTAIGEERMPQSPPFRILMVDDNIEHIRLCREYLPEEEFEFHQALSFADGLNKLQDEEYDLVVLDYDLPDGNGVELFRRMQELGIGGKVILVTGQDDPDLSFEAMRMGASDYMVKTFRYYTELRDRILEIMRDSD
jgi:DNA-binding response OmpR family regulator